MIMSRSGGCGSSLTQIVVALIGAAATIAVALISTGVIDLDGDKDKQDKPIESPEQPGGNLKGQYSGMWQNDNPNTSAITRFEIWFDGNTPMMHWWGACSPNDCDNGVHPGSWDGDRLRWDAGHTFLAWLDGGKIRITINHPNWSGPITEGFSR
jgi:hypothetical protein